MSAIALKRALDRAERGAFLWVSRGAVARSSAVTFAVLASSDHRLSSLVYKLGDRSGLAERLLQHESAPYKSGLAFVTAVVALRSGTPAVFSELVTRVESDAELLLPLASALAWLDYREVRASVEGLLAAPSAAGMRLGLMAAAAHRVDPGVALDRALDADAGILRATALETVGRLAIGRLLSRLSAALKDEDAACRFRAAWSAVRLGDRSAIPVLGRFTADGGAFATAACDIALRALDVGPALRAHKRLLSMTDGGRLAVLAAGIIGDPALADWLLDAMEFPPLARLAAAAFCLMTGRDLRRDDLDSQSPPPTAAREAAASDATATDGAGEQPSTSAGGDPVVDEVDDDLSWPDPVRLRAWWNGNRRAFAPGVRYLAGVPIRPPGLSDVLRTGNQQQRAAAALELALLHSDGVLLDVTGPAHRQKGTSDQFFSG
jgi:uncharacterized protein (TIGR02270 family)